MAKLCSKRIFILFSQVFYIFIYLHYVCNNRLVTVFFLNLSENTKTYFQCLLSNSVIIYTILYQTYNYFHMGVIKYCIVGILFTVPFIKFSKNNTCNSYWSYFNIHFSTNCYYDPDLERDAVSY